jgi:hypothetical protein
MEGSEFGESGQGGDSIEIRRVRPQDSVALAVMIDAFNDVLASGAALIDYK